MLGRLVSPQNPVAIEVWRRPDHPGYVRWRYTNRPATWFDTRATLRGFVANNASGSWRWVPACSRRR